MSLRGLADGKRGRELSEARDYDTTLPFLPCHFLLAFTWVGASLELCTCAPSGQNCINASFWGWASRNHLGINKKTFQSLQIWWLHVGSMSINLPSLHGHYQCLEDIGRRFDGPKKEAGESWSDVSPCVWQLFIQIHDCLTLSPTDGLKIRN